MTINNSTEAVAEAMPKSGSFFTYTAFALRFIASFSIIMNICVLLLLIRLKKKFRNYSYWFQIVVLASEDLFNGVASLFLTFFDQELFKTSTVACSMIICAYEWAQLNTLFGICCICVNRFKSIQRIDKLEETRFEYQQEISVTIAALLSFIYSLLPFLIFPLNQSAMPVCSAPALFGGNIQIYKLTLALGLIIPLLIINTIYSICLFQLRGVSRRISPANNYVNNQGSQTDETPEGTSSSKTKNDIAHVKQENTGSSNASHGQECSIVTDGPPVKGHSGSNSDTSRRTSGIQRGNLVSFSIRASTKQWQTKAVKLLGIILVLTNVTVIAPVSLLLRDTVIAPELQSGGSSSLGLIMLALNSLVDAFIYGFYASEIRKYIRTKFMAIWKSVCGR